MTLDSYIHEISSSTVKDWTLLSPEGAGAFYARSQFGAHGVDKETFTSSNHTSAASFKKDLAISLAWGLEDNDDFRESWANKFPDPKASTHLVDFFYNNTLVLRELYVAVDGGRCLLPLPDRKFADGLQSPQLSVPRAKLDLLRLLNALTSGYDFEDYIHRASIEISTDVWPN